MKEKRYLIIDANNEGYTIPQCDKHLTIGELREILNNYDDDCEVVLKFDDGYTFGGLDEYDFEEKTEEEIKEKGWYE